jgi:hypothetical protein
VHAVEERDRLLRTERERSGEHRSRRILDAAFGQRLVDRGEIRRAV